MSRLRNLQCPTGRPAPRSASQRSLAAGPAIVRRPRYNSDDIQILLFVALEALKQSMAHPGVSALGACPGMLHWTAAHLIVIHLSVIQGLVSR